MQTNRLFEIVYMLLARPAVTAKELAEHFAVSTRTIYRDIEALSAAGIPVYMCQGKGGGIRLMDHYVLSKAVLSEEEQREIVSALQGIGATTGEDGSKLLTKLNGMFQREEENWIEIDYSDWSGEEKDKFDRIKQGILSHLTIQFDYYGRDSVKKVRIVNPLKLYFRDKTWYLYGYCKTHKAMRMFKLRRMKRVVVTEETFDVGKSDEWMKELQSKEETVRPMATEIVLQVDESMGYRVYDEFREEEIEVQKDQSFLVTTHYVEDEWVYGMILSYGPHAKVIRPERVRNIVKDLLKATYEQY